ncbi:MAG TPA: hypothetical protein VFV50_10930 [Bdellovibrionales bacterium]|nr:hypothetical protein [Bdellovibrionales bacterium]
MKYIVLIAAILAAANAQASTFSGPVSTSLGGAGSAGVHILEASHLNPATLPHLKGYYMGVLYNSASSQGSASAPASSVSGLGLVITDASDEVLIPAAASYTRGTRLVGPTEYVETEIHVGVGFNVVKRVSAGLSVDRITRTPSNGAELIDHNATLGALFAPYDNLGFSLVFKNMLETRNIEMNPTTTVGAFWMYEKLWRAYIDLSQPQKRNPSRREIVAVGVENSPIGGGLFIRTGGRWDQYEGRRFLTAGLGWDGPNLSLDYGYEKNLDYDEYRHLVDMRVQF